jgi:hypothetical protein
MNNEISFILDLLDLVLDVFPFDAIYLFLATISKPMNKASIRELKSKCFHSILRIVDQSKLANPLGVRQSRVKCKHETALNRSPLYSMAPNLNDNAVADPASSGQTQPEWFYKF